MIEHITLTRCDRCNDKIACIDGIEDPTKELALSFMFDGTALCYSDLCPRCRKLVTRCLKSLRRTDGAAKADQ